MLTENCPTCELAKISNIQLPETNKQHKYMLIVIHFYNTCKGVHKIMYNTCNLNISYNNENTFILPNYFFYIIKVVQTRK